MVMIPRRHRAAVSLLRAIGDRLSDLAMKNRAAYVVEALFRNSASEPKAKEVLQAHRQAQ